MPRPRWRRPAALAIGLYVLLGVLSFLPVSLRPRDTIAYVGDSLESVYIVAWNVRQAFRAPARLFEANVLHPHRRALAFTDHRLLPSLAVAPVVWATRNPVLATNVAILLACLLAALAGRRLAGVLGCDAVASWAAGALYGFHTYQVNEAPRLNIVAHGFVALAVADLVLYLRHGERRHGARVALWMLLQGLSSNYHLLYGALTLGLVVLGFAAAAPRETLRRLPLLAGGAAGAALLFAPLALPYLRNAREQQYERVLPEGIDLRHYVSTAPGNVLYGPIGLEVRLQQRGPHFVGFASLALALFAVAAAVMRRSGDEPAPVLPPRAWVPAAAALALLFVALSLGRDVVVDGHHLGPGPYRLLHAFVPGFRLVRIPERLALVAMLFVALLVARALTLVARRHPAAAVALAALVAVEHVSPLQVFEQVPVGRAVPEAYRWIARNPTGAVAEVPVHGEARVREETIEMYLSTAHWRPIVHGYTAYPPLLTRHLRRLVAQFPHEVALQAMARVGVDTVVVHHGRPLAVDLAQRLREARVDDPAESARLLKVSRQDLYDALPAAAARGRVRLLARFEGSDGPLFRSARDEVYRLGAAPPGVPAPFPGGARVREAGWRYRTKMGDPGAATDGDLGTAWVVPRTLVGDEFFEVTFQRPVEVSGVVLRLRRDSAFPTRFRVAGRGESGPWTELARFDDAHQLQLLETLLRDPREAAIGFELGGRALLGVSLLVEEAGTSFEGWRIPEVEVWAR
ncbi:MAG TPA: discoidin domain-containing protein [Vicinamibacteria bacterium]|nr:discoidin domain-containing protein [Vicinamibacteria bacterium]